jgi:hypothetical protein
MSNHPFEYHKPSTEQAETMATLNLRFKAAYDLLVELVPGSADRTLAIRKLQEARMWANAAVLGLELPR